MTESHAYDPAGRLASVTDALGRTTAPAYYLNDLPQEDILQNYRQPDPVDGVLSTDDERDITELHRGFDGAGNQIITVTGEGPAPRTRPSAPPTTSPARRWTRAA